MTDVTKKVKLDDGKAALATKVVASPRKSKIIEEEKKTEVPVVVGPPKDIDKLKPPSS